jgi:glycosyltransferase involved in cell wall biosynthesis
MPELHIHLISFDIPVPVNYGGAIDVYYKILALHRAGVKVHLHCFEYDRQPAPALEEFCEEVCYYKRDVSKARLFSFKPFIVATRSSVALINRLLLDDYPILFEGLHSCFFLSDRRIRDRIKVVRTHNIEHDYYSCLGKVERNLFKRYYFLNEAGKLRRFEKNLRHAEAIAAISPNDAAYFSRHFSNVHTVSAFHPNDNVSAAAGSGDYALYHGSLEVGENHQAAMFLVNGVFAGTPHRLLIAGNKPLPELRNAVKDLPNIKLVTGLSADEIYKLVSDAHINILPTFQATGIKLKLLAALFRGRHCLVNTPMVINTGLEKICHIRDDAESMKLMVAELFAKPFTEQELEERKTVLQGDFFSNNYNARTLIQIMSDKH